MIFFPYGADMATNAWLQQSRFRELVDLKVEQGITKEQQAQAMGMPLSSLITWYSGNRAPGMRTIHKLVAYYQVPMHELADDPSVPIPGVDQAVVASLSPAKRLILRSMAKTLDNANLSGDKAVAFWQAIDDLIGAGLIPPPDGSR